MEYSEDITVHKRYKLHGQRIEFTFHRTGDRVPVRMQASCLGPQQRGLDIICTKINEEFAAGRYKRISIISSIEKIFGIDKKVVEFMVKILRNLSWAGEDK
ncbi:MAG TPA: hypothetical protein ENI23_13285 [bacterium]|nr:hypothetical protein [bacterium]